MQILIVIQLQVKGFTFTNQCAYYNKFETQALYIMLQLYIFLAHVVVARWHNRSHATLESMNRTLKIEGVR